MTTSDFLRLAAAVRQLEEHRRRVQELTAITGRLAGFDVIVVAGEQAVLEELDRAVREGEDQLTELSRGGGDGGKELRRLEELVARPGWQVLDEVQRYLEEKQQIVRTARTEVEERLSRWSDIASRVEAASQQIQTHRLRVHEPRRLTTARYRLTALVRQAHASLRENRLLDVWRAIGELESAPADPAMRPEEVPDRLEELIRQAVPDPLHLTVLRGPLDGDQIEYTLMLLTPTGDQYVGINVQDSSTIVRANRQRFLRDAHLAGADSYRTLRDAALPESALSAARAPDDDTMVQLRIMGRILYRLVIPTRMREVIEQHQSAPLVVITNDRELSWELMYADDFVALRRPLARMPVGRAGARRALPAASPSGKRRVALVGSAGGDRPLPAVPSEIRLIAEGLARAWPDGIQIDVFLSGTDRAADGENFERVLIAGDYDIIHYAGHAYFDKVNPGLSGLLLDGPEACPAEKIQRLVYGTPLVFLNACETARLTEPAERLAPEGTYEGDPREGLAGAFLYGGALACIGNSWPVPDAVAAGFAVAFYTEALDGQPLGEAMRIARQRVADADRSDPSWASFVLYGDPSFSLNVFDNPPPERPAG